MNTYFATPERSSEQQLKAEIEAVGRSPVVSGLLHAVGGLLAILDEHLQIVALNDSFLHMLGVENAEQALGLRLGESLGCVHACEDPAGCGTTPFCETCGAAVALVSALGQESPAERTCALKARRGASVADLALLVRSHAIRLEGRRFLLVFLQDITRQQQWAALERTFFHDVNNMLSLLMSAGQLLAEESPSELSQAICGATERLTKEVAIQRCLLESETNGFQLNLHPLPAAQVLRELEQFFAGHSARAGKRIRFEAPPPELSVTTDISLLMRVLCNMVTNALEATPPQGEARVWAERAGGSAAFCVWNAQAIPEPVARRVFQRNFSTKQQAGRGVGTFSMRLFGEKVLGGRVTFTTSPEAGTVFRFELPCEAP